MDIFQIKTELKAAYDKDALRRTSKDYRKKDWKIKVRQSYLEILLNERKKTLLELGAGNGIDAKFFLEKGLDVVATDISEGMVKACKELGLKAVQLDLYDLKSLNQQFDAIYSMNVLLHVPKADLPQVLQNISDTLNPNGLFYYGVYGGTSEEKTVIDNSKIELPRFFSFLSDAELQTTVKQYFDIVDFDTIDIDPARNFHYQSLLLRKKQILI